MMQSQGISTYQLAKKIDISQQTLHNILERDDLKLSQLVSIARALNINVGKLLEEEILKDGFTLDPQKSPLPKKSKGEMALLRELLEEKERVIDEKERVIDMQQEVISLLKNKAG